MTNPDFWTFIGYGIAVLILVSGMLGISYVLGEKHHEKATGEQYESGIVSTGTARRRLAIRYYLMAMMFLVFDLESIYIYSWAVVLREAGWTGYIEITIFIGVLMVALFYLWREGAIDWRTPRQKSDLQERMRQ
jgi:NADH-quinone oxidoreductase subunit A